MTRTRVIRASALVLALVLALMVGPRGDAAAVASPSANLQCARSVVATWSLTRVARETVAVSAQGSDLAQVTHAASQGYGAFLLFGATAPPSLASTIRSLARLEPDAHAPLVMSDDEGGDIIRFSNLLGRWPWPQVMGTTLTPAQITGVAHRIGVAMARWGLNVDLAPVADVDGRAVAPGPGNPDGLRSFGGSPSRVANDVVAFAQGLRQAGVLAVVKHFPGLGYATASTDYAPAATQPWAVLQRTGLVPFRRAIDLGVRAVMMSNASIPGLTTWPAGLSAVAVAQLRGPLGFRGLIMSDALGAVAISARHLSIPQASVDAVAAGVDLVLGANDATPARSLQSASLTTAALVGAVLTHRLTRARLVEAAAQVLAATSRCAPAA